MHAKLSGSMFKLCLVIIFNHKYEAVLDKLKVIYKDRFSNIKYLMPFYRGDNPDVISVYEGSHQFQGYITQGLRDYYSEDIDYYIFIGDDVLLAPWINESNIIQIFKMQKDSCFITDIEKINQPEGINWPHSKTYAESFQSLSVNWKSELPDYSTALTTMREYFGSYQEEFDDSFFDNQVSEQIEFLELNKGRQILYPLAYGYSDFLMISKKYIKEAAHMFGIFSSMNLFVEIAIPSTLVLVCDKKDIITLKELESYNAKIVWSREERGELMQKYNCSIKKLFAEYDSHTLYCHPVKLSRWKME